MATLLDDDKSRPAWTFFVNASKLAIESHSYIEYILDVID